MSKKFLPLAGIAMVLAVISYLLLSFLFPHKQAEVVDTSVKAESVFGSKLNEAEAQATATTAEQSDLGSSAAAPISGESAPTEPVLADESALEVPVQPAEGESAASTEAPVEAATAETPAATEATAEPIADAAPASEPAAEPASVEPSSAATEPESASTGSGLSREQLARIVAEAAAKAAAETAKSIAEQAARDAAGG